MGKLWICLLLATLLAVNAQKESEEWNPEQWDYYNDNYDGINLYDDDTKEERAEKVIPVDKEAKAIAVDYQIEDNRSAPDDETAKGDNDSASNEEANDENQDSAKNKEDAIQETKAILKEDKDNDFAVNQPEVQKVADSIVEETKRILEETDNNFDDFSKDNKDKNNALDKKFDDVIKETKAILKEDEGNDFAPDQSEIQSAVVANIVKETKQILEEADSKFDDDNSKDKSDDTEVQCAVADHILKETKQLLDENDSKFDDETSKDKQDDKEDNKNDVVVKEVKVDDVIEETRAILKEDKENDFAANENEVQNPAPDAIVEETKHILDKTNNNFEDDEDKDKESKDNVDPFGDLNIEDISADTIDKVYEDLNEDLDKLLETWKKLNTDSEEANPDDSFDKVMEEKFDFPGEKIVLASRVDSEVPVSNDKNKDVSVEEAENNANDDDTKSDEDNTDEENDEEFSNSDISIDKVADSIELAQAEAANELLFNDNKEEEPQTTSKPVAVVTTEAVKTIEVADLTPAQYDQVMTQFKQTHSDVLDIDNDEFSNIAPIHMTLSLDETTEVTSPNFPRPYPTNNIIDWIFTGEGVGIELNITDFHVNGVVGDYLLVKPGGIDDSGTDGIVFSYRLTEPRRFRFLDVDRMFVRFVAMPGMAFTPGFRFTTRMVAPSPLFREVLPEPEPLAPEPEYTITLFLGGKTLGEFRSYEEQFRVLLADMGTMYINANDIDPGMNSTLQTTQIVHTGACNINWPGHENCSRVTFGIPLVYEDSDDARLNEEDLRTMWDTYRTQDPFASRLSRMGIEEFEVPNDRRATIVWVLIGLAVAVMMTLLALALWRYSCLENYSRMPQYSDRDSVYSAKQGLDLYPTPHQTLPPLYAENDYKWDDGKFDDGTRVDMGGFTNKNYSRDMYDMDSDDDIIIAPRTDRSPVAEKRNSSVFYSTHL